MSTLVVQNLSLGVGGLPNGSVLTSDIADGAITTEKIAAGAVATVDLANAAVTAEKMSGAQSGSAPVYGARAWVNFNGTTGAIRASGNVSGITRHAAGDYTVTFATAMPDADYAVVGNGKRSDGAFDVSLTIQSVAAGSTRINMRNGADALRDCDIMCVSIFR